MGRELDFADGFESSTAPVYGFVIASGLSVFPSDAAYVAAKGSAATEGNSYWNSTVDQPRFFDGSAWRDGVTASGTQNIGGDKTFTDDVTISGDLTVNGTMTSVNSDTLEVEDPNVLVNKGGTQATADMFDAGLTVDVTDGTDAKIGYDSTTASKFKAGDVGSEQEIVTTAHAQTLTEKYYDGGLASNSRALRVPRGTTAGLDALTDTSALIAYDTDQAVPVYNNGSGWFPVGAATFFQEPLGTGDGVTTSFGPLTYSPNDEDSILVLRDGIVVDTSEWSLSGADILFSLAPAAAQNIYVFYPTQGFGSIPSVSGVVQIEYRTLTVGEAAAESLTLSATPASASKVMVDIIGGTSQEYAVDYTVSGTTLSWAGLGLTGLVSGNKLRIWYQS